MLLSGCLLTGGVSSGKSSDILSETNIAALLAMQGDIDFNLAFKDLHTWILKVRPTYL